MSESQESVKTIFGKAIEIRPDDERAKYLDQACAGDESLRAEVEDLLGAIARAGSFLGGSPAAPTIDQLIAEKPGTIIGPYKLLQEIGEGGFGVVYMAEQTEPVERRAALKIIKPGMDTRQVVARFEAERQALAMRRCYSWTRAADNRQARLPFRHVSPTYSLPLPPVAAVHRSTRRSIAADRFIVTSICHIFGLANWRTSRELRFRWYGFIVVFVYGFRMPSDSRSFRPEQTHGSTPWRAPESSISIRPCRAARRA